MQTNIYTLPELTFVGGKTQELNFRLKRPDGTPYNARACTANFAICNYSNKTGTPFVSITPEFRTEESGGVINILHIDLPATDTLELFGKYIYQITIIDDNGNVEIPNQGIMNITRNINIGDTSMAIPQKGFKTV